MKTPKNQRGLAHIALAAIIVVIATAIGVAAWRISASNKTSTGGNKPVTNKAVQSACLKEINDANLCKFAANFTLNTPYKAVATVTGSSSDGTMTILTDGKGNTSLSSNAGGQQLDSITLDNSTYIKDASSGTWMKYTSSASTDSSNPANNLKISTSDLTNGGTISYKALGKEACGSLTCFKYQQIDKSNTTATQYVWFDDQNYQLQRFSYSDPTTGTTDMTFTYQAVNITAPSPVTNASTTPSGSNY